MADQPRLTILGKLAVLLFVGACFAGAFYLWRQTSGRGGPTPAPGPSATGGTGAAGTPSPAPPPASAEKTVVGVAYGTEKRNWLTWAAEEFAKTPDGARIEVNLIPMGSIEAAHAVLKGDQTIHAWAPASSLYKHQLVDEWRMKNSADPIARQESLALTPMVFVFWEERYAAFAAKYKEPSFRTVARALAEPGGWSAIGSQPQWGLFKFGHTHPNQSNSGLMTLVLEAYDFHGKSAGLTLGDVTSAEFQTWAGGLWRGVSGLSNSTGNMMKEMVQRGPSTYDALFLYESTAIDFVKSAEGRWGKLRVVYPERNAWNDNPFYVLNVPWSSPAQRKACERFLAFLLTPPVQTQALQHGFRPADVGVPINGPDSPFTQYAAYGLRIDLPNVCEPPPPEVINNLLLGWQRVRPN